MPSPKLSHTLAMPANWRQVLLQAAFIFLVVLLSLYTVSWVMQRWLIAQALVLEAATFTEERLRDSDFPLPRTRNLTGYLAPFGQKNDLPTALHALSPGLHRSVSLRARTPPVPIYVEDSSLGRLYLVFEGYNVDRLIGLFGIMPLSIMLLLVYGASWVAYRLSASAISPLLRMAHRLRSDDAQALSMSTRGLHGDTRELALAVEDYARRMDAMIRRERQFSADVSHELRTPVTIMDGASQFLATETGLSPRGQQRVQMIRRACKDIGELIDAFLVLGREPAQLDASAAIDLADVAQSELHKLKPLVDASRVELHLECQGSLRALAPRKVLEILIGNLCRNAIKYTEVGTIRIIVTERHLRVEDTGPGIDEALIPHLFERHVRGRGQSRAGEGLGLNIVKRLCDLYGWDIRIANRTEGGVVVTLIP